MVEITTHVAHKGSVNDLEASVVFCEAEHVTTKMEFFLAHICHSLTDDLSDVFGNNRVLFGEVADEKTQSIYLRWGHIDVIRWLFKGKIVFFFDRRRIHVSEILLDIFESNEGDHFGFDLIFFFIIMHPFFQIEDLSLGHIVIVLFHLALLLFFQTEIPLSMPLVLFIGLDDLSFPLLPVELIKGHGLEQMSEMVGFVEDAIGHIEPHEFSHIFKAIDFHGYFL